MNNYLITIEGYRVEEDNFNEGCTGHYIADTWYGDSSFYVSSKEELIEKLADLVNIKKEDIEINEVDFGLFGITYTVNEFEESASDEEIEMWKEGNIALYLADLEFTIQNVSKIKEINEMYSTNNKNNNTNMTVTVDMIYPDNSFMFRL